MFLYIDLRKVIQSNDSVSWLHSLMKVTFSINVEYSHLSQRLSQIESQVRKAVTNVHRQFGDTVTFQVCPC